MKIIEGRDLQIPGIKVVRFARFRDHRGYFTEHYRKSDFANHPGMADIEFLQANESFSRKGTVRGLHFQWNPYMGKLVRTMVGHMVDMVLDIRKGSPSFGKILCFDMPAGPDEEWSQWIWVPPGFAHGNFFLEDSMIEYFCSGEYSQGCEAGISPIATDLDWSLCDPRSKEMFDHILRNNPLITDKDRNGFNLATWVSDVNSEQFVFGKL